MSSANAAAAQALANRAASGGPLDALLQQFEFQTAQELLNIIMSDLAAGINPREMARDLSNTLDEISYGRAETIARTESLTSWNDAALENYRANSDIVGSWMWMCFPGPGTCVSCLEEDGTIYNLDEELDDHPNGRCVKAPVTNDYGSILDSYGIPWSEGDFGPGPWDDRQSGEEWLLAQDAETQRAAFGSNAAYNAWASGDAPLKDFVKIRHDPVYGDSIQQQSLRGMGLNAKDYSAGSMAERAVKEAEAKAAAEREAEAAAVQERLTTAQARWEAVRGELPEHPLYVSDSGAPGAVPSKVMLFSDYAAERKALLELWDAQALADAAKGVESVAEEAATAREGALAESAALADAQHVLDGLHDQWLAAKGEAERDLRGQMERQQYEVEKAQAALDRATGGRGTIIHIDNPYGADPLDRAILEQAQQNMFGRTLSNDELASLVGAPPGSYLQVSPSLGATREQQEIATNSSLHFRLNGPSFDPFPTSYSPDFGEYQAERYLSFNERGQFLKMDNVGFHVRDDLEGQGYGVRIFADEVDGLSKQGVRWIETNAAGAGPRGALAAEFVSPGNGYYTWPRFGYAGHIPNFEREMLQEAAAKGEVPASFGRYTTVQQLMRTPEGRTWWKEWGGSVENLRFDLRDGSLSRRVLDGYLNEKGLAPGSADYWSIFDKGGGSKEEGFALREGEGTAGGGHAAEEALTARIDRIPADATVPDMQDWITQQLPGVERVDLMSLDAQTARLVANTTVNLIEALPEVANNLYRVAAYDSFTEALAYVPLDGKSIIINTDKWLDLPDLAARIPQRFESGWWVAQTPEDVLGHEIGHAVQVNYHIANDTWVAAMDRVEAAGADRFVSTYAGRNVEESFAETFALLVYGTPTDAQLPIVREMAALLRENNIDYNALRAAVGEKPLDVGVLPQAERAPAARVLPSVEPPPTAPGELHDLNIFEPKGEAEALRQEQIAHDLEAQFALPHPDWTPADRQAAQRAVNAAYAKADYARGVINATVHMSDETEAAANRLFGRELTTDDYARLGGAQRGNIVWITSSPGGNVITYKTYGDGTYNQGRIMRVGGKLVLKHDYVRVVEGMQSISSGAAVLRGLNDLRNLGIEQIRAHAARGLDFNGYYTWAKLGFTGDMPWRLPHELTDTIARYEANGWPTGVLRDQLAVWDDMRAKFGYYYARVETLMAQTGGPAWWKEYGVTWDATFDLTPGSVGSNLLNRLFGITGGDEP